MPIYFSDREMKRAWKSNFQAYDLAQTKTNAHRLGASQLGAEYKCLGE